MIFKEAAADYKAACRIVPHYDGCSEPCQCGRESRLSRAAAAIARARAEGRLEVCRAGGGYPDSDPLSWAAAVLRERETLDEARGRIAALEAALVECSRIGTRAMAEVGELTRALDVIRADCERAGIPGEVDVPDPGSDDPAPIREWRSTPGLVTIALAQRLTSMQEACGRMGHRDGIGRDRCPFDDPAAVAAWTRGWDERAEAHADGVTEGRREADALTGRIQNLVRDMLIDEAKRLGVKGADVSIDGGASDGDEIDFTRAELSVGLALIVEAAHADGVRVGREEAADLVIARLTACRRSMDRLRDEDGDVPNPEAMRRAERREALYVQLIADLRALPAPSEPAPTR